MLFARLCLKFRISARALHRLVEVDEVGVEVGPVHAGELGLPAPGEAAAAAPCAGTYYYIDTTDEGEHFVASGELYERCKADGVPYDYRVRNGLTGAESSMGGFLAAKSNLMDRIKN